MILLPARRRQRGFIINPFVFGAGGGGAPTDPYFANVVSLLHFNGTDGSTTFTDVKGKTWTAAGNAQIDTAQSKFGGASGLFDGSGDFISTPDSADFAFASDNFTIEGWFRFNSVTASFILGQGTSTPSQLSWMLEIASGSKAKGRCFSTGDVEIGVCTGATTVVTNQWYHVAYVRSGNNFSLYLDGTSDATATSSSALHDATTALAIGRLGAYNGQYYNGWIDDLRVTKGVARYTANFTPPSAQFPDS